MELTGCSHGATVSRGVQQPRPHLLHREMRGS